MLFKGSKTIETERLILRKINENDYIKAYNDWCSDESLVKYTIHGIHKNIEVTKNIFDKWIEEYNDEKTFRWIIVIKEIDEPIGTIDINNSFSKYDCVSVGYIISSKYSNKGYCTEALNTVINYLFNECDVKTIYGECMGDNIGSKRVLEKCNMKLDGILRNRCIDKSGKRQNLLSYSIIKDEYN